MFPASFIEEMLEAFFKNIDSQIEGICERIIMSPAQMFGDEFWNKLITVSTKVFMPFALTMLAFFLAAELYNVYCKQNGQLDLQLVSVTILKFALPYIIITRTYEVINFIFNAFNGLITKLYSQFSIETSSGQIVSIEEIMKFVREMDFGGRLLFVIQLWIMTVVLWAIGILITIIIYGRMFEIMLFWLVSPLSFSTLVHNEHSQIGKNYIKMFIALLIQAVLMVLCVIIYSAITQTVSYENGPGAALVTVLGYSLLLVFSISKTGHLAKRMVGTF